MSQGLSSLYNPDIITSFTFSSSSSSISGSSCLWTIWTSIGTWAGWRGAVWPVKQHSMKIDETNENAIPMGTRNNGRVTNSQSYIRFRFTVRRYSCYYVNLNTTSSDLWSRKLTWNSVDLVSQTNLYRVTGISDNYGKLESWSLKVARLFDVFQGLSRMIFSSLKDLVMKLTMHRSSVLNGGTFYSMANCYEYLAFV